MLNDIVPIAVIISNHSVRQVTTYEDVLVSEQSGRLFSACGLHELHSECARRAALLLDAPAPPALATVCAAPLVQALVTKLNEVMAKPEATYRLPEISRLASVAARCVHLRCGHFHS